MCAPAITCLLYLLSRIHGRVTLALAGLDKLWLPHACAHEASVQAPEPVQPKLESLPPLTGPSGPQSAAGNGGLPESCWPKSPVGPLAQDGGDWDDEGDDEGDDDMAGGVLAPCLAECGFWLASSDAVPAAFQVRTAQCDRRMGRLSCNRWPQKCDANGRQWPCVAWSALQIASVPAWQPTPMLAVSAVDMTELDPSCSSSNTPQCHHDKCNFVLDFCPALALGTFPLPSAAL